MLQVQVSARRERPDASYIFKDRSIISGRPAAGVQVQSRIPFDRRTILDLSGDWRLGLQEAVVYAIRMPSAKTVGLSNIS